MSDTHAAIILATNLLARDGVTVDEATAASYIPAGMPLTNVLDEEPSNKGRITTLDPSMTFFGLEFGDANTLRDVGMFAVVGDNMASGSQVRLTNGSFTRQRVTPLSLAANVGFTGAVGDIDEDPVAPDVNVMVGNEGDSVRIRFNTPGSAPTVGADLQSFVLAVEVDTQDYHTAAITWQLYQNGVALGSAQAGYLATIADEQYIILPWNAADLDTASGALVELSLIVGEANPAGGPDLTIHAVAWDCVRSSPANDSGWITLGSNVPTETPPEPQPVHNFHHRLATVWEGISEVTLWVRAAPLILATGAGYPPAKEFFERDTYLDVGTVTAGPVLTVKHRAKSLRTRVETERRNGQTDAGGAYGSDAFSFRRASAELILARDESTDNGTTYAGLDDVTDQLDWRKGLSSPLYIALEPGLALSKQRRTAFWATIDRAGDEEIIDGYKAGDTTYSKRYDFREKL